MAAKTDTQKSGPHWMKVLCLQTLLIGGFLAIWQFAPESEWIRSVIPFMNSFFISSPSEVAVRFAQMVAGQTEPNVWPLALASFRGILLGGALGMIAGAGAGLVLSHWATAHAIVMPYLTALNATPKLALVPIFVVVLGPTGTTSIAVTAFIVLLITLFSAVAGGRTVPDDQIRNAHLLGATGSDLLRIRWKYVTVWTFAVLPNILATSFVAGLLTEALSTSDGLGRLVRLGLEHMDATGTMALVVFLSVIGATLSQVGRRVARWRLHWFPGGGLL